MSGLNTYQKADNTDTWHQENLTQMRNTYTACKGEIHMDFTTYISSEMLILIPVL